MLNDNFGDQLSLPQKNYTGLSSLGNYCRTAYVFSVYTAEHILTFVYFFFIYNISLHLYPSLYDRRFFCIRFVITHVYILIGLWPWVSHLGGAFVNSLFIG